LGQNKKKEKVSVFFKLVYTVQVLNSSRRRRRRRRRRHLLLYHSYNQYLYNALAFVIIQKIFIVANQLTDFGSGRRRGGI
jgi:hypothetical protein